jgi:NAD(P)-dependent dehydrogenase (short-subunit alcohol dehydrogenase family)
MVTKTKGSVVITGSAGYLGKSLVQKYKSLDYHVIGIDHERNRASLDSMQREGSLDAFFFGDLSSKDFVEKYEKSELAKFDVAILVNCAGGSSSAFSGLGNFDAFSDLISMNLFTLWNSCSLFVPKMMSNGGGRIVNFASAMATISSVDGTAYCTAKSSVIGFTRHLATYGAPHNVLVNSVSPSHIKDSPRHSQFFESKLGKEFIKSKMPLQKLCEQEDVINTVVFLASDENKSITGQNFLVDGGFSLNGLR